MAYSFLQRHLWHADAVIVAVCELVIALSMFSMTPLLCDCHVTLKSHLIRPFRMPKSLTCKNIIKFQTSSPNQLGFFSESAWQTEVN